MTEAEALAIVEAKNATVTTSWQFREAEFAVCDQCTGRQAGENNEGREIIAPARMGCKKKGVEMPKVKVKVKGKRSERGGQCSFDIIHLLRRREGLGIDESAPGS